MCCPVPVGVLLQATDASKKKYSLGMLALGTQRGAIVVWDMRRGEVATTLGAVREVNLLFPPHLLPSTSLWLCGCDRPACHRCWRVHACVCDTHACVRCVRRVWWCRRAGDRGAWFCQKGGGHSSSVNAVAFGPDMATLASCANERRVLLWDLEVRAADCVWSAYGSC